MDVAFQGSATNYLFTHAFSRAQQCFLAEKMKTGIRKMPLGVISDEFVG